MAARRGSFDVLILGGGTAGCVLAARLSERTDRSVCLVEAGPDYGHFDEGRWPADLLDPTDPPDSHDWEPGGELSGARCKVIGGCSAHNACFVVWPTRADCEEWRRFGGDAWGYEALEPYLRRCAERLCTRVVEAEERNPWARGLIEGAVAAGIPEIDDLNDPGEPRGIAWVPVNVSRGARWSTALAYLDQARSRQNLTIVAETLIARLTVDGDRAAGATVIGADGETELSAETIIVSAGAYGSPAVLLRSGIGPEAELGRHGLETRIPLDGVGQNLIDHPGASIELRLAPRLSKELEEANRSGRMFRAGAIARAGSDRCPEDSFDLHLLGWTPLDDAGAWGGRLSAYAMKPRSTGRVTLRDPSPSSLPRVEHGFISDPDGSDLETIVDGLQILREIAADRVEAGAIEAEIDPGPEAAGRPGLTDHLRRNVRGYFHPVGACRIGGASDPNAVVDGGCRLHGTENVYVCDASVMPTIPAANTNLTTVAIAERIAERLG